MEVKQLVYASRQVVEFDIPALVALLDHARERNASLEITGTLLFCNGIFVQCLEGPSANVDALYESICRDRRHHEIVLLQTVEIGRRHFAEWTMGCARIDESPALELMRAQWSRDADAMDASPGELSPGFILMKSIWQTYRDYGLLEGVT